jgi:membrane-associated phospholipid phosphatase
MRIHAEDGRRALNRWARLLTELLAPSVIVFLLPLAVAWDTTRSLEATALWGLLVAFASSLLPMAFIVWGSRTGRWDGHHVRNREGRLIPFLVLIVLSATGLAGLVVFDAPRPMIALDISLLGGLVVTGLITLWWKVSLHTAVAGGAVMILSIVYTAQLLLLWLFVAAVGWSRVHLGDHTASQVVVGACAGGLVGGGLYVLAA